VRADRAANGGTRRREKKSPASATRSPDSTLASPALPFASNPFAWPLIAAATASESAAVFFTEAAHAFVAGGATRAKAEPVWTTPNRIALELQTMRLRDFSRPSDDIATLICAPFALHAATIADFAPGHSLVATLRDAGRSRLFVTDWRSARADMRFLTIDNYLADLNVAIDTLGAPVDLVGLCQGGWLALVYAARFPGKVRRLVLAGAPVDIEAGKSTLSTLARDAPLAAFEEIVRSGEGCVPGHRVLHLWAPALAIDGPGCVLQVPPQLDTVRRAALEERFRQWYDCTVDLPGTYYLQVAAWLFKENRIAAGRFVALGRVVDLAELKIPVFLVVARDVEIVSTAQLLATARLIGTPPQAVATVVDPCTHLSLFMGAETLVRAWGRVARWLRADLASPRKRPEPRSAKALHVIRT
jgi:poly(3-hydroxyalkanoate) synthetase